VDVEPDASGRSMPGLGFLPSEISSRFNERTLAEHASAASFLWMLRRRAVGAPHYKLKHLALLDARLSGHLEGLRMGGTASVRQLREALANADHGTVFAWAYLAFFMRDRGLMREALQLALAVDEGVDPLVSALAWLPQAAVTTALERLGRSAVPAHRRIALAVFGAKRIDAGPLVTASVIDPDPMLRACALRAAGLTRRHDLLERVVDATRDSDPTCRLLAAKASALLGRPDASALLDLATHASSPWARPATELAVRCGSLEQGRDLIRALVAAGRARRAIVAIGELGDPASIPWLLEQMRHPVRARVAGEAFSSITGADLGYLGLKQDPVELGDETEADALDIEEDRDLPWPDPGRVTSWWEREHRRVSSGSRFLCGRALNADGLIDVLRHGYQRDRRRAAFELACRGAATAVVFAVDDRSDRQTRRLAA